MSKNLAKKIMAFALAMALSCSVFMGSTIDGYATSVSGNQTENANADVTVSGNEINVVVNNDAPAYLKEMSEEDAVASKEELSTVSGNGITSNFAAPTDLKWAEPGVLSFVINDLEGIYTINLERDGAIVRSIQLGDFSEYYTVGMEYKLQEYTAFDASGTYRFRVKISETDEEMWDFSSGCVTEYSEEYVYTLPSNKIPNPSNVRWSMTEAGVVYWDTVDYAYGYEAELLDKNGQMRYGRGQYGNSSFSSVDFSDKIGTDGPYSVRVRAVSNDIENITHSDWSHCDYTDLESVVEGTNTTLNSTADKMSAATDANAAHAVITELQTSVAGAKNDFKVSMQSSDEVKNKIQSLEDTYRTKANITQKTNVDESLMDPSKISILGASLNAVPNANVNFNVKKATDADKALINTDRYKSVLAFEMGLEGDGINSSDLAIPVCITLPIPEGMNAANLRILHYSTAGADPVIYDSSNIRINGDGTFSFTITHFSLFAIVEAEEGDTTIIAPSDSVEVVCTSGSGTNGAAISYSTPGWTPTTPDEMKRYALMGKEPVEYVAATTNAYNLTVLNSMQGPKCFVSFEAVLGDYKMGRTYSIYPAKNKVSSMEQAAKLTITIPNALRADGRSFKMICVTEDGTPYILNDLDKDPNTITFETNKFYAFALIYK